MVLIGMAKLSQSPKIASLQCLYNISIKKLEMKLIFCMQLNIKVDFNTLDLKVFFKLIISLLMGMITHSQSTQSNKFNIFTISQKRMVRHVQSTQNRKLVIILQYNKKLLQLLFCSIEMQNIQIFHRIQPCLLLLIHSNLFESWVSF